MSDQCPSPEIAMVAPYPHYNRRHEAVLLWLLENPSATLTDCAKALGYSRTWISRIVNSPEFRRRHRAILDTALLEAARRRLPPFRVNEECQ